MMKKSLFIILTTFSLITSINFFNADKAAAMVYCDNSINFAQVINDGGKSLTQTQKDSLYTCACNNANTNYSQCKEAKKYLDSEIGADTNTVKVYRYQLATKTENGQTSTVYSKKINDLIDLIQSIINASVGVIIFILAFGFLYNVTQMGIYSSNPQQRVMCLKRLGDVFGTAFFIGCIPMIMKLLLGLIALL